MYANVELQLFVRLWVRELSDINVHEKGKWYSIPDNDENVQMLILNQHSNKREREERK